MKKILPLFVVGLLLGACTRAQFTRHIVRFRDKGATAFTLADPSPYLSSRAINRRTQNGIAIDSTDLPVPASYISQVKGVANVTVLNVSRWLNAVCIQTTDAAAITTINSFPFVQNISAIAARNVVPSNDKYVIDEIPLPADPGPEARVGGIEDFFNYGTPSYNEIHLHKGEFLHNIGLRGQGLQVAVLDAGFLNYTTLRAFDSANLNGQVLSTWDFVNREASVVEDHSHGMQCLSTIAANIPGQFIGKAPKASFHLFRTEEAATEYPIEEFNWVCGAERADSVGADVISTSLGYNTFDIPSFDHTYNDMNGNTTISAIGADLAARKGLLVFASVGNEGSSAWHYLATPSDGDSVIAVGAVNATGNVWAGSGFGPSFDGRIKPDMASVGLNALIQGTGNTVTSGTGTSFAAPNMAGLGTCLWQGFPEFNNMRIARALREAGSIFNTPNDRIGYGIPDMKKAFSGLLAEYATSNAVANNCTATLSWTSKDVSAMKYEIERKTPGDPNFVKIAEVNPQAGTLLTNHSYQYNNTLSNVGAGVVSYRIRQVIDTASAGFSAVYIDTASFTLAAACTTTSTNDPSPDADKIIVQPNPTTGDATLVVQTGNAIPKMPIRLFDVKGRLVMQLQANKAAGKATFDIPSGKLAAGKYIITVYDERKIIGSADLIKL